MELYEDVVQYDIYKAIQIVGGKNFKTLEERNLINDNDITKIKNHSLLTNYEWVYEHVEELFCNNLFDYQKNQGVEEYFTFFKALINKYSLEEDYIEYMSGNFNSINIKWNMFAIKLIEFISYSFDDRLEQLLDKEEVINYFLNYSKIYNPNIIENFHYTAIEKFLKYNYFVTYYIKNYQDLINLIRNNPRIRIPKSIMLDKKLIKKISRTSKIKDFYSNLNYIGEQVDISLYLEEHIKYCDEQVNSIKDNILPCYLEKYNNTNEIISINDCLQIFNSEEYNIVKSIFESKNESLLPKKVIYEELSKYMLLGMYISRNFETNPVKLLVDIKTLHDFVLNNNIKLRGEKVYEFLVNFESKSINEILEFYNYSKNIPLSEILYDDWVEQKSNFINELNSKLFAITDRLEYTTINGIKCYDITDIEGPILVHNTSIKINDMSKIEDMVKKIKTGCKNNLCLSVQDKNHHKFYTADYVIGNKTIKLAYGPMNNNKVGIIYHEDAYSWGNNSNSVEVGHLNYKRRLYTLKSFMELTKDYNEILYVINGAPFLPIALICENVVTEEESKVAEMLDIPILYRDKKKGLVKRKELCN